MATGFRCALLLFCDIVLIFLGSVHCIDISFDDSRDGFLLKSPYHKFKSPEPSIVRESLILTHPAEVYKLRASYGPFEMYEVVPNDVITNIVKYGELFDKTESSMHRNVIHNMDISAHMVSATVSRLNPTVQVLVHALPLTQRHKQDLIYSYYGYSQRWCAQIFVSRGEEEYTSVCVLNGDSNACVAGLQVPDHWWDPSNTSLSDLGIFVSYDLARVEQNQECASMSNTIVPARADPNPASVDKKFISSIQLVRDLLTFDEYKDKDLIFRVPQGDLRPNTRFQVPVLLERNSPLKEFVIQVKVRGGLVVEGASPIANSNWNIRFEAGDKDGTAQVTVYIKEDVKYSKSFQQEEIMQWQFKVLPASNAPAVARIAWTVDYRKNGLSRNAYFSPEGSRIAAKFNVATASQLDSLVAVMKEQSVLNTAILTGKPLTYDLVIYSVSYDNSFRDVTKDCSCRSTDPEALKVAVSCDHVFLDGSETRGAKNVTVLVRTAERMAQLGVRVWVPEPRLDIQLSDSKLSQVRGWRVEKPQNTMEKRSVDLGLLTHTNVIVGREKGPTSNQTCSPKYQQSLIDVYARFIINAPGEPIDYYRSKKTYVRVTSLIQNRLTVADPAVAKIVQGTVAGVSPGRTEVQVISPTGKLLGAKEVRVGSDKVDIERMVVHVISGMALQISEDRNLPGAIMATVHLRDLLVAKQQEAVLDIAVEFKDETMLPLFRVDPAEFELKVTSVNPDVVEVTESITSVPSLPPSIKAVGNGKGEIVRVILRESAVCNRKKPRTLDTEYVHVQVDFTKDMDVYNVIQSDGYYYNRASDRRHGSNTGNNNNNNQDHFSNKEEYFKHQQHNYNKQQHNYNKQNHKPPSDAHSDDVKSSKFGPKISPIEDVHGHQEPFTSADGLDDNTKEPKSEALAQAVNTKGKHPTSLEIGMYVLVAVFAFAILVFAANCAIFMVRYQRKCSPKGSRVMVGSISQAPDWVWIGRATLERSGAGNTGCNHALMAEEDFNGNQMVVANGSSSDQQRLRPNSGENAGASSTSGVTGSGSSGSSSNRNSVISTYKGSECSIRITSNPLLDEDCGMGYNEAEWDYEAMGMTYEQLMEYFDNLKESSA